MRKHCRKGWAGWIGLVFAVNVIGSGNNALAQDNEFIGAITDGTLLLHMHSRLELVDDESNDLDDATALTHRTYFGWKTGTYSNFSALLAFENVVHLVDDFNVPGEDSKGYDVVADPEDTEVEQAFISFTGIDDTTVKLGRQYITYRPAPLHRFIGTVPWRQNWQSMDAITVENRSIEGLKLSYAYVDNVNRIFGNDNPDRNLANSRMSSHFVNVQYADSPLGALEGFYYRLDYDKDNLPAPFTDRDTLGVKLEGKRALTETMNFTYLGEFSHQRSIEDNDTDFDTANQYRVELGLTGKNNSGTFKNLGARLGYEVLESDGGISFSTPLATVHAFQGWADRFIGFPGPGVEDIYVFATATIPWGIKLVAVYHDFALNDGGDDYGEEIDFQATKKFGKVAVSFKHASYFGSDDEAAGATGIDKTVSWLFLDFKI